MALKGERTILYDEIRYFCNDVTERGVFLAHSGSGGSGVSYDNTLDLVYIPGTGATAASGLKIAGLLLNDIVDVDLSKYRLNPYKDEMKKGGKCRLLVKSRVYTNALKAGDTPGAGQPAYVCATGFVTTTSGTGCQCVGTFRDRKDASNFVLLDVDVTF